MSTFKHTMMVVDRMHELCEEQGIEGHDRVRRLLMAVSHDIGKSVVASGLHSDDPPTRFGGHDEIGAGTMQDVARRLGLSTEFEGVMSDACEMHMDVHNMPMMAPNELLDFVDGHLGPGDPMERTLPLGARRDSGERKTVGFHNATVWELIDLAHADHEGRLQLEVESNVEITDDGFGQEVVNEEQFHEDGMRTVTDREFQPEFDREQFVTIAEAVIEADDVAGYEALETGLCAEHSESEIDRTHGIHVDEDRRVQAVMADCPDCRTPDEWVGDMLESMRVDRLQAVLDDD